MLPRGTKWVLYDSALIHDQQLAESLGPIYCASPRTLWLFAYYYMIMLISGAAGGELMLGSFTAPEQACFTLLVIFSALLWSQIIASFCDVFSNMHPDLAAFRRRMDELNKYCHEKNLDSNMRRRLREYIDLHHPVADKLSQRELLCHMSPKLQGELELQARPPCAGSTIV